MIDRQALLSDLKPLLKKLEDDLRERAKADADADARLRSEWHKARDAKRTAQAFEVFRDDQITQIAVAWILSAVFVRFLEDNGLVDAPLLSGPTGPINRLQLARDRHTLYFQKQPRHSDVHYLRSVFTEVGALPGLHALFDERHNALWQLDLSPDGATLLLGFFQKPDDTGKLAHDFTDKTLGTRFLGDLYQDLSERARKQYALLQTPEFVEEFILDRTLEPAIEEFGLGKVRLIDPACGSGHFLLGAFQRLLRKWDKQEPGTAVEILTQRALDAVAGVDLNPFAVAIARFRLLCAALKACDIGRLKEARDFQINLAAGDSLLHGPRSVASGARQEMLLGGDELQHVYQTEDAPDLRRILGARYHVVVGNPPYITPKDPALNKEYRERYGSCHMKYSLGVPFTERSFDLAIRGNEPGEGAGYVGLITANSFMKREFGKKLIEHPAYLPSWDLTHVIDTSGAYIPGHGTPTVILFARNRSPVSAEVRMVLGIRGEPTTPEDPAKGLVWSAILDQTDRRGATSTFVSVSGVPRERLAKHPWAIGGGGAAELKEELENSSKQRLSDMTDCIGRTTHTGEDEVFYLDIQSAIRKGFDEYTVPVVLGEDVRDGMISAQIVSIFPYDKITAKVLSEIPPALVKHFWTYRNYLRNRRDFDQTPEQRGLAWYEHSMFFPGRFLIPNSIAFAEVATHNHFALDRGGKVFKQTAPVIKLPRTATEDDHFVLLGILNSSVACFWMKQVFYPKATATGDISTEKGKPEANRYAFASTGMLDFPLPSSLETLKDSIITLISREIATLVTQKSNNQPQAIVEKWEKENRTTTLEELIRHGSIMDNLLRNRLIALQEELDWECYRAYGLVDMGANEGILRDSSVGIFAEQRPFLWTDEEARRSLPAQIISVYSERRKELQNNPRLQLIESDVYKRLWLGQQGVFGHASASYADKVQDALRGWLLRRLEDSRYWPTPQVTSAARLADRLRDDAEFLQVAELYRGRADFDLTKLVGELVLDEGVPYLSAFRYNDAGRRKREVWEQTWDLQRKEDAGEKVGDIPVPPKYASADFQKQSYWRLRGKLDVPKETFILYPGAEREADPTPVFGWAGWDHKQQAEALVLYFQEMQGKEGWNAERLAPLLVGLFELLPWLKQWHNERGPGGRGVADDYEQFLHDEARSLGLGIDDLKTWAPAKKTGRGRGRKAS